MSTRIINLKLVLQTFHISFNFIQYYKNVVFVLNKLCSLFMVKKFFSLSKYNQEIAENKL